MGFASTNAFASDSEDTLLKKIAQLAASSSPGIPYSSDSEESSERVWLQAVAANGQVVYPSDPYEVLLRKIALSLGANPYSSDSEEMLARKIVAALGGTPKATFWQNLVLILNNGAGPTNPAAYLTPDGGYYLTPDGGHYLVA